MPISGGLRQTWHGVSSRDHTRTVAAGTEPGFLSQILSIRKAGPVFEVRPFEGSAVDLSDFITGVWRGAYAGKMAFPLWTPEYFEWQFDFSSGVSREQILAAYDGGRVVGALLGLPFLFRTPTGIEIGLFSSWLSVDAGYRGRGIVGALKSEQARSFHDRGGTLIFAYRYVGSRHSLSKRPTDPELASGEWSIRRVGFWVRILDPRRAAKWSPDRLTRIATTLGAPFTLTPRTRASDSFIRPYEPRDLAACVEVVRRHNASKTFAIDWDEHQLAKHCEGGGVGRCLVAERNGEVRGFVTFHILPFQGLTVAPVGVFDIVNVGRISGREQRRLLTVVLATMREQGAIVALKLRTGDAPLASMLATGFVPWSRDSWEAVRRLDEGPVISLRGAQSVLWR